MKTEQIRLALEIARARSISRAAASLFISQPTASNLLKSLENEIGYPIFVRKKSGLILTEKGSGFIEQALQIERSLNVISQIRHEDLRKNFRVLSFHLDLSELAFEKLCEKYHSEGCTAPLEYQTIRNPSEAVRMVTDETCDLAVLICLKKAFASCRESLSEKPLKIVPLGRLQMQLSCSKGHPILENGSVDPDLLRRYPGFSVIPNSASDPYIADPLSMLIKQSLNAHIITPPGPVRYRLLRKTNGYLISPPLSAEIREEYGLDSLAIDHSDITVFAMYRKDTKKKTIVDEYLMYCRSFLS